MFDPTFMWQPSSSGSSGIGQTSDPGSSFPLPSLPNPSSNKAAQLPAPQDAVYSADPGSYSSSTNVAEGKGYDGGYASFSDEGYYSPEVGEYEVAYAAPQYSGYDGSAPGGGYGYGGDGSYAFVAAPQDEHRSSGSATGSGATDEDPEPVFSDVSDLEPVYSFSSRSRYQRGRAVFAQTRYTPGELVPPPMPVSRRISKATSKQSRRANAPTKGGF